MTRQLSCLLLSLALAGGCKTFEADTGSDMLVLPDPADLRTSPEGLLDLGKVKVGETVSGELGVVNLGEDTVTVELALDASHPETWTMSPTRLTVAGNRHEYTTITVSPEGWGDHSGKVTITDLAGNELFVVAVNTDVDEGDD